jgi:hypothetical protein
VRKGGGRGFERVLADAGGVAEVKTGPEVVRVDRADQLCDLGRSGVGVVFDGHNNV